ncbi:MAG: hypothetical protein VX541_08795, partial [Candidatus Poribacteria bacterium]|nr:hypothetical protein [Candidatus Poribacteria bacterium]
LISWVGIPRDSGGGVLLYRLGFRAETLPTKSPVIALFHYAALGSPFWTPLFPRTDNNFVISRRYLRRHWHFFGQ